MTEVFEDIDGYDGVYQVSTLGRVKSFWFGKERILIASPDGGGYLTVGLCKDSEQKNCRIHKLVAETFICKPKGFGLVVDHIDNDQLNNELDNLQWVTNRENSSKDKKGGSSKYVGVSWHKGRSKWHARISVEGKHKHIGCFTGELEAAQAYQNELSKLTQ